MKVSASSARAALIGDVVGSRHVADRADLHRRVTQTLAGSALALTVGDEFQGSYPSVGDAIDAALRVRLALAPDIDVRFGIGWGGVTVLDTGTGIQDGPGWWAAREAIQWTATAQQQPALATVRTAYRRHGDTGPEPDAVNAALLCRDHLLGSMDPRSLRLLRGLLDHKTKKELAAMEGISASAVSQRTARDGLDLLVLASEELRAVR